MVTLKQIAALTGVSIRSVSVVLNGKAAESRISTEVAERIQRTARELNYRPNTMARAIRLKKSFQIGVLVRELSNPFTGTVIEAIENNFLANGYRMLLGLTHSDRKTAHSYLEAFSQGAVDGILNLDPDLHEHDFAECKVAPPYIHFMRPSEGFSLHVDHRHGIGLGLKYLWKLGHRRIGFISGAVSDLSQDQRLNGYLDFYQEKGLEPYAVRNGNWTFDSGKEAAKELLKLNCTAIFAANDPMAAGALKQIHSSAIAIPEQVSVIGFDDSMIAEMLTPSLTSVHMPLEQMASQSVKALFRLIAGDRSHKQVVIKPTLSIRESTAKVSDRR